MITKELLKRISIEPHTLHGKPRIKGTRIAVSFVLELLAAGHTPHEICSDRFYPDLSIKDSVIINSRRKNERNFLDAN